MEGHHQYIDLSGVREPSSSADESIYRDEECPETAYAQPTPPPRRSTTGSPRHSISNGHSGESSGRPSYLAARRSSAGTAGAVAVPGGVPLRRRDSIKHPYSLPVTAAEDKALNDSQAGSESTDGLRDRTTTPYTESYIYRASAHSRRHSASVDVLHRDASTAEAPVNTTVSASPDRPDAAAAPVATTQEDVKRYVYTVMTDHATTIGTWEQRVAVAEVYRDRPLRTGGLPAALRVQDRGFLERVTGSLRAHRARLDDARSLLLQTRRDVPRTKSGGHGDLNAWDEYCSCYEQTLTDLTSETKQTQKRVERLLKGDQREGPRTPRTRAGSTPPSDSARVSRARSQGSHASRRSSPQATPRGPRHGAAPESRDTCEASAPANHRYSAETADASSSAANHTNTQNGNGAADGMTRRSSAPLPGSGAVQRGSHVIRPGHASESAMRASPAPESQPSWTRASSVQTPPRHSIGSVHSATSARSQQHARALHPDTVVRQSVPAGSPNDMQSPYGRLRSPKRASSPLRDPTHAILVVPPPAGVEAEDEAEVPPATGHSSRTSRTSRAVSSSRQEGDVPPQLRTYSSPRGTAGGAAAASPSSTSATPSVHPLRRRQLLEVIEHYEKHSATLQRGDLHRARECFYELYGEQQGLRQYCLWIDDIALSALRVSQTPV